MKGEIKQKTKLKGSFTSNFRRDMYMYLLLLPSFVVTIVFAYFPIPGIILAFKNIDLLAYENVLIGMFVAPWADNFGFGNIIHFFKMPKIWNAVWSTFALSSFSIAFLSWIPIALAILFNEIKNRAFKRTVQTISYLPHFLSMVTIVGIVSVIYGEYGLVNDIRLFFMGPDTPRILLLAKQWFFVPNILMVSVWTSAGWGTIIYLANISGIDAQLFEAAKMDGANKLKQVWYIILPSIIPVFVIMLIFSIGGIFTYSFDIVWGFKNTFIKFDTIDTLVFRTGIIEGKFVEAAAVGITRGAVGMFLVMTANWFAKKFTNTGFF